MHNTISPPAILTNDGGVLDDLNPVFPPRLRPMSKKQAHGYKPRDMGKRGGYGHRCRRGGWRAEEAEKAHKALLHGLSRPFKPETMGKPGILTFRTRGGRGRWGRGEEVHPA